MLDEPIFPYRGSVGPRERAAAEAIELDVAGRTIRGPVAILEHWVRGGSFHPYGRRVLDELTDEYGVDEAVGRYSARPACMEVKGQLRPDLGYIRWMVSYRRAGDPDASGFSTGGADAGDVCYSALSQIEDHEREIYEQNLVVGIA